ncbi:MAG TPA: hypothetical protein VNW73_01590 [Ktedonobacteraceae bacterium]|nr:hypothetical protein [Ktedonobacteraceae bacterium]
MKLVGILRNLPFYIYAEYDHKTTEQRGKSVDNSILLIGNPDLSILMRRMIHVHTNMTRFILFK